MGATGAKPGAWRGTIPRMASRMVKTTGNENRRYKSTRCRNDICIAKPWVKS